MPAHSSGQFIAERLAKALPSFWDGRACIAELKQADYNWRQMEWIGWWFEFRAMKELQRLGATVGPTYGSVTFDCALNGVWDFKAHPLKRSASGYAYLNDEEVVDTCLEEHHHIGWIIAVGNAIYDESGDFKRWHEQLKGPESEYVKQGRAEGRPSRARKSGFTLTHIVWIDFRSASAVNAAVSARLLRRGLQASQRNSDGNTRRPKYGFSYTRWRNYSAADSGIIHTGVVSVP